MSLAPLVIHIKGTTNLDQLVECAQALERLAVRMREIEYEIATEEDDREQNAIHDAELID